MLITGIESGELAQPGLIKYRYIFVPKQYIATYTGNKQRDI